jgi:hypothetical protein
VSAIEDVSCAAGVAGKDTHSGSGSQPSVGGVHPVPVYPHLPYGDAVYAQLVAASLAPDLLESGLRTERPGGPRELFLTLVWLPGHPDIDAGLWPRGMHLSWSHVTGWSAHDDTVRLLLVDDVAAPALLADAVLHLATDGLDCPWEPEDRLARWDHARALDLALQSAAERGDIAW